MNVNLPSHFQCDMICADYSVSILIKLGKKPLFQSVACCGDTYSVHICRGSEKQMVHFAKCRNQLLDTGKAL